MSNRLIYVRDVTIPDGTVFEQGAVMDDKTWRIRNGGTTRWRDGFVLKYVGGPQLGGPTSIPLPPLNPGEEGYVTLPHLVAPPNTGHFVSSWFPCDPMGATFNSNLTIVIDVVTPHDHLPPTGLYELPLTTTCVTFPYHAPYTGTLFNVTADHLHHGVDLRATDGTPVFASAEGIVRRAEPDISKNFGFGRLVVIEYAWGDLPASTQQKITGQYSSLSGLDVYVYYAHLSTILVSLGSTVHLGTLLAKSGRTGNVDAPHLHVELRIPRSNQSFLSLAAQVVDPGLLFALPRPC